MLGERIVQAGADLFLRDGFAATSIEAVAAAAGCSKRTFYARFASKEALFGAVLGRLIGSWRNGYDDAVDHAETLEAGLTVAARRMLDVALTPQALALRRLVVGEADRVRHLAAALNEGGARLGIESIARLLARHRPSLGADRIAFLAEQFQHLVLAGPQSRAMGLGEPMDQPALAQWTRESVRLILLAATPAAHAQTGEVRT